MTIYCLTICVGSMVPLHSVNSHRKLLPRKKTFLFYSLIIFFFVAMASIQFNTYYLHIFFLQNTHLKQIFCPIEIERNVSNSKHRLFWCFNYFYFINNKTLVILRTEYCVCHLNLCSFIFFYFSNFLLLYTF